MPEFRALIESSFLDWDDKVCAVVYVPRCNLRCPFCHNWMMLEHPEELPPVPEERIIALLEEHGDFLDGLCITGGEPVLYPDLAEFIERVRGKGALVKLDTNGTVPEALDALLSSRSIDYVAMDIKAPLDERYEKAVGCKVDLEKVKESISLIMDKAPDYEFRTTVVPAILAKDDVVSIAKEISGARRYVLQQYVPENAWMPEMRLVKPYPRETVMEMAEIAKNYANEVVVR
ncbi:MAG: anaerobic ribonucleoside-triphosphate reductase activating protein [Candidatus Thermoplasmatota archaeon]